MLCVNASILLKVAQSPHFEQIKKFLKIIERSTKRIFDLEQKGKQKNCRNRNRRRRLR